MYLISFNICLLFKWHKYVEITVNKYVYQSTGMTVLKGLHANDSHILVNFTKVADLDEFKWALIRPWLGLERNSISIDKILTFKLYMKKQKSLEMNPLDC